MKKEDLTLYKSVFQTKKLKYYTDLFNKPIWGDMGEDSAAVYLSATSDHWHIHFIRTQSGEPYPLSDTVCNVIDEYEKDLSDDELYDYLMLHHKMKEFEEFVTTHS